MKAREEILQELIDKYVQLCEQPAAPSASLAELENDIWAEVQLVDADRAVRSLRAWFAHKFGGATSAYEVRAFIFKHRWAHPLFKEIDDGMRYSAVREIYMRARELAEAPNVTPAKGLKAILDAYNGTASSIRNAKVMARNSAAPDSQEPETESTPTAVTASKTFKTTVMHQARQLAKSAEEVDVDPVHVQRALAAFEVSLERVVRDFLLDISRHKSEAKKLNLDKIGETRFSHACEVLGLKVRFGDSLNPDRINRAYRNRAAPLRRVVDVAHGAGHDDERTQAAHTELSAVNNAYELLRHYTNQRKGLTT